MKNRSTNALAVGGLTIAALTMSCSGSQRSEAGTAGSGQGASAGDSASMIARNLMKSTPSTSSL